jgi:hypothetical protein
VFGLFYPRSAIIDDIPDRIAEDLIARAYANDLVTHLIIGDLLEDDVYGLTLLDDEIALLDVQFEQSEVEVEQSQAHHAIHDLLQLACVPHLYQQAELDVEDRFVDLQDAVEVSVVGCRHLHASLSDIEGDEVLRVDVVVDELGEVGAVWTDEGVVVDGAGGELVFQLDAQRRSFEVDGPVLHGLVHVGRSVLRCSDCQFEVLGDLDGILIEVQTLDGDN